MVDTEISGYVKTYYVFTLGAELYALDAEKINEIKVGYEDQIDPVPLINSPVMGVMKLGREIVPIIDLRLRLEIKEMNKQSQTGTVIVVEMVLDEQKRKCGIGIDSLLDVTCVRARDVIDTSLYGPDITQYFISNRFSPSKEIIKILDVDVILNEIEILSEFS